MAAVSWPPCIEPGSKEEYFGLETGPSAPVKAFDQKGASPFQANVTGLKSTVVTAFP